jgi:galactokinase
LKRHTKEELTNKTGDLFQERFEIRPEFLSVAPGRVNIIGEHTDYTGGFAMPSAIDRWICTGISKRIDKSIHAVSVDFQAEIEFSPDEEIVFDDLWKKYVYGAIRIFTEKFTLKDGLNILIHGNVPIGSGVSSSAALEVSLMNAFRALINAEIDDLELIKMCQQIDHRFLNIKIGLLDQFASQFSRENHLLKVDFAANSHSYHLADFSEVEWILIDTGIRHELAASKYMERVKECARGLEAVKRTNPSVISYRDILMTEIDKIADSHPVEAKRLTHFYNENRRVAETAQAIEHKKWSKIGNLLSESHESLKNLYEVSCPELDFLVDSAQSFPHWLGGRMMGGGFGGCTLNLLKQGYLDEFKEFIMRAAVEEKRFEPKFLDFRIVGGAEVLEE